MNDSDISNINNIRLTIILYDSHWCWHYFWQ